MMKIAFCMKDMIEILKNFKRSSPLHFLVLKLHVSARLNEKYCHFFLSNIKTVFLWFTGQKYIVCHIFFVYSEEVRSYKLMSLVTVKLCCFRTTNRILTPVPKCARNSNIPVFLTYNQSMHIVSVLFVLQMSRSLNKISIPSPK